MSNIPDRFDQKLVKSSPIRVNSSLPISRKFTKSSPVRALEHFCNNKATGRLQLFSDEVAWIIRLESGKITYARHSVEPFEHLVCHIRHMSSQVPSLNKEFRTQICTLFEDASLISQKPIDPEEATYRCGEYEALCWLATQEHMHGDRMAEMVEGMIKEAIEPLFWLTEVSYQFSDRLGNSLTLCRLDLETLISDCQTRFKLWQELSPQVWSPFQRPFYCEQTAKNKGLDPNLREKFKKMLNGFSFRHLSVLMRQNELKIAKSLMPYVNQGVILLREPQSAKLPRVPEELPEALQKSTPILSSFFRSELPPESLINQDPMEQSTYTIACVDDSPTVLTEIGRILNASDFKFVAISDSLKAPIQLVKLKPDLILLDVNMPNVDGYKLCGLLKNNPDLKNTPIVMVTGNSGIVDRAKAKLAGSSDFLTKPFTHEGLLKMVFRHLS